ncbi:MAG: PAS domain S-box protein, partial [Planctomycetaceae bacterium]
MAKKPNRPQQEGTHPSRRTCEPLRPRQQAASVVARPARPGAAIEAQQLDLLLQLSCDGVVLHELISETAPGNFLQANQAICRLLGYNLEEMRRLTPLDILAPEDLAKVPGDTAVMERDGVLIHQKTLLAKDGRRIPVEISSRLFEHDGKRTAVSNIRDITERKRVEEALRQSEEKAKDLIRHAPAGIYEITFRGPRFRSVNDVLCQYLGYTREELLPMNPFDILDERGKTVFQERIQKRLAGEKVDESAEYKVRAKDGRQYDVILKSTLTYKDGEPEGALIIAHDVTAHKQAEEALRESERRLRLVMEGAQMGRWEWDLRTHEHYWSERVYELLGLELCRKASTRTLLDRIHPADKEAITKLADQVITGETDFRTEFRILCDMREPRGEVRWLSSQGTLVRNKDGRPERVLGMLYDITQRKQMEAELRQLNERLEKEVKAQTEQLRESVGRLQDEVARRVMAEAGLRKQSRMLEGFFRHTVAPLAFLDRRLRYVRVNEAYARANGKVPEYFAGKDYFSLHSDPQMRAVFEQVMHARQPYLAHALPHVHRDDPEQRLTFWDWQLTPLLSDTGDVQFLVLNLEDVTKEQTALRELEHRAGQLQKLTLQLSQAEDHERKRLADLLHDDLQQILAAAKFHIGLLDSQATDAGAVHEIAGEIKQMLKEAIDKSRSLSHELSPVFYQVDLADVFEWLADQMQSRHGLTVHVEVRGRADSPSEAMKAFLYKAAHEMLFNIIKHAGVNRATLRLRRMRKHLWLTISDQGQGFDPKTLAKTSGFGLLTIRERVELLGGRMRIKSTKGRGSIFLIAVPDLAKAAPDAVIEPGARRPPGGGLRVLLV